MRSSYSFLAREHCILEKMHEIIQKGMDSLSQRLDNDLKEILINKQHYYREKFLIYFGNRGEYLVSVIFTKSYFFDYDKQEMIEAVGIEKVSCNLLCFKQNILGDNNEN
ncbi:hypothetical protein HG558_04645 [Helicobacter pylori]|uniref:hypothetical protein n=1 Tax=Helicobacter pylori TaxID=210 RepID=UPI001921356F|nr:hypothetical protein [Helicobacter pylori]QQW95938.1 hypothetical protein HG558_04645 [Helicobacter pylori]